MNPRRVNIPCAAAFLLAAVCAVQAAETTKEAKSAVASVTVMPDRAVVTRRFEVDLAVGRTLVLIDGLLPGLDERTLKCLPAVSDRGATVVDLASEVYQATAPVREDLAQLDAKRSKLGLDIRALEDEIVSLRERGRVLGQYRTFSDRAMKLGLVASDPPIKEWKEAIEYILAEGSSTTKRIRDIEKRKFSLTEAVKELNAAIGEIKNPQEDDVRRARVLIDCRRAGKRAFNLSYLVRGKIKWGPRYEVRLSKEDSKLELTSLAGVTQGTGEDWTGALLTFSTRRPARGLRAPEVEPLVLAALERPSRRSSLATVEHEEDEALDAESDVPDRPAAPEELKRPGPPPGVGAPPAAGPNPGMVVRAPQAGGEIAEFAAKEPVTVRSDGRPVLVPIGTWRLDCRWHLETVPKILSAVYIHGVFTNGTRALMLGGPGDCYVDDEYVGQIEVPTSPSGSRVHLSFGAIDGITVSRTAEPLKSTRRGWRKLARTYYYEYVTELANTTPEPAEITVLDNMPVSAVKGVAITLAPETTAAERLAGGKLRWKVKLPPGERRSVRLSYSVEISKEFRR